MSTPNEPLYLGFDLSTQQLKAIVVNSSLKVLHEAKVDFDGDLSKYGIKKGVHVNLTEHEVYAPVTMWLEAVDLVLQRLKEKNCPFHQIKGLSGSGQQHGSVYWTKEGEELLGKLDPKTGLMDQLKEQGFAHPYSPNWQDASTQAECDAFDAELGSEEKLAEVTGSKAHHRFTGPQIMRFHKKYPEVYRRTSRITLVSSFLASLFLGKIAPFDISDVCGMDLWDIKGECWSEKLLTLAAGSDGLASLKSKLGEVRQDGGGSMGPISSYFTARYDFPSDCAVVPFTGDNPATILALPLRPMDAIVSLGTSTTFLMSTPNYYTYDSSSLKPAAEPFSPETDARTIVESQILSLRLRSQKLVQAPSPDLPAQPHRIYLVGGGSLNPAIARIVGDVLGGTEGVWKLDVGGNACALGGAYKAVWAVERGGDSEGDGSKNWKGKSFEELIGERWTEEGTIQKIDEGYKPEVWKKYGGILKAFEEMENKVLEGEERHKK
ncbi:D-xylulose kinase A protein [Rutstroemia sp. NJR-2017a WRK4]|nr:D-xylulose kinase A protein [Rutstroemia sp. NJR-2017a WRK4]